MKNFIFSICIVALTTTSGCDKSEPTPDPVLPLAQILTDRYWVEESYLYTEDDGEKALDGQSLYKKYNKDILGGDRAWEHALHIFKVNAKGIAKKYKLHNLLPSLGWDVQFYKYTDSAYRFEYDMTRQIIRLEPMKSQFELGWSAGQELRLVSATDSQLVFDSPVRDNTRNDLKLSDAYTGIRTTWTRIDDPDNTEKWRADLTEAFPDWTEDPI